MFCPNCGREVSTGFCPYCGTRQELPREKSHAPALRHPPLREPFVQNIAGVDIDLHMLIRAFGMGWRKACAYRYLEKHCGITFKQAQDILDPIFAIHKGEKITHSQGFAAEVGLQAAESERERNAKKQYHQQLEASGAVYCPKCLSTGVAAREKGFSAGKAIVGAALAGGIGLLAGNLGSKKIRCVCLKCGHKWEP